MKSFKTFLNEDDAPPTWSGAVPQVAQGPISSSVTRKPRKWHRRDIPNPPIPPTVHSPMAPDPNRRDPIG
jgi:hypothetical protein